MVEAEKESHVEYFKSDIHSLRILIKGPKEIYMQGGKETVEAGIWADFYEGTYMTVDTGSMTAKEIADVLHNSDAFKNGVIWTAAMEEKKKAEEAAKGDKEGPFVCPYCTRVIKIKAAYLNHIRAYERNGTCKKKSEEKK